MQTAAEFNAKPTPAAAAAPLLAVKNIEVVYDNVILVLRGLPDALALAEERLLRNRRAAAPAI